MGPFLGHFWVQIPVRFLGLFSGTLLDTTSEAGAYLKAAYVANDDQTILQLMSDALAYQIQALLACPDLPNAVYINDAPVELMICPEGGLDACLGYHDMEQAGCDT